MNFTHFDLEGNNMHQQQCDYDRIEVHSKVAEERLNKHGVFCGTKPPPLITSEGNVLRITFTSDTSVQKTGFAAVFFTGKKSFQKNKSSLLCPVRMLRVFLNCTVGAWFCFTQESVLQSRDLTIRPGKCRGVW